MASTVHAQEFLWAKQLTGANTEHVSAVAVDLSGNVYLAGDYQGVSDFDPGPGVFQFNTDDGDPNGFVATLDDNGDFRWAVEFRGPWPVKTHAVTVDLAGFVYAAGWFLGTVDFDPGPSEFFLTTSLSFPDGFLVKLDHQGTFVWATKGVGFVPNDIAIDNSGHIVVASRQGVSRLDSGGALLWNLDIGDSEYDWANGLAPTADGIVVAGEFNDTVDFDPGPGVQNRTSFGGLDAYVLKLSTNGNLVWVAQLGGLGADRASAIGIDESGNIYITGSFAGTADFDPTAAAAELTSNAGGQDVFLLKLHADGTYSWVKGFGGSQSDWTTSLAVDSNLYVGGQYQGTTDFDPGSETSTHTAVGDGDGFISSFARSGEFLWVKTVDGLLYEESRDVAASQSGHVYLVGNFEGNASFDQIDVTALGTDVFVSKLFQGDADEDGSPLPFDCDDNNPGVYPGASEVCDFLNNNCNHPSWPALPPEELNDAEGDGHTDVCDNCPLVYNPSQADIDADTVGNSCDNCLLIVNPDQQDTDADFRGDACDNCGAIPNTNQADADGDSIGDLCDNCKSLVNNDQSDLDGDGKGDSCDICTDTDADGFGDFGFSSDTCPIDNCPGTSNASQEDVDGDATGDICDNCPTVTNADQSDLDADEVGDVCDNCAVTENVGQDDEDGDGHGDACDNCPLMSNGDQQDLDADGWGDPCDNCELAPNATQDDSDADGIGSACDNCVNVANVGQDDSDLGGVGDACDNCPEVANANQDDADANGTGDACNAGEDSDGDEWADSLDSCPARANPNQEDVDSDLFGDACDNCPTDYNFLQDDFEHDGVGDVCDNCIVDSNLSQSDFDADLEGDACDIDDGVVYVSVVDKSTVVWQAEEGTDSWNIYCGDLEVLRSEQTYTQAPGSNPLADQQCGLTVLLLVDEPPSANSATFYIVSRVIGGVEGGLGMDSSGTPRANDNPCP